MHLVCSTSYISGVKIYRVFLLHTDRTWVISGCERAVQVHCQWKLLKLLSTGSRLVVWGRGTHKAGEGGSHARGVWLTRSVRAPTPPAQK